MKSLLLKGCLSLTISMPMLAIAENPASPLSYIDHLNSLTDYCGRVSYSVLLPQAEDPVTYDISLQSTIVPDDTLSPCRYLIEWTPGREDQGKGFAAYLDGSHYRYRDNRLQEYHMSWDSIPFIMGNGGVQCNAQFVDVLPQFLGRELSRLLTDSNFVYTFAPDTLYNGRKVAVIDGKLMYHGYVSKEATYILDPSTLMPLAIELENNPGAISEQSVSIRYDDNGIRPFAISSEDDLMALYPEVFEKYRESNFRIENLPGTQLPTFTAPMPGGERYAYHRGDPFKSPVVIALVDDCGANTAPTLQAIRDAAAQSPAQFDIIIAFVTNDTERASDIAGRCSPGETLLTGARTLARDCGAGIFPTLIYVTRDGHVKDVNLGYNKDLTNIVIQTATLNF